MRRIWFRRLRRKGKMGEHSQLLTATLLGLAAAFFLICWLNATLHPQVAALAHAQLQNHMTLISNQAVMDTIEQQALTYSDMVILQLKPDGEVQTMSVDTVRLNSFRSLVLEGVTAQIGSLYCQNLGIPLGVLTGIDFLSARGPQLPIKVTIAAAATGQFRNEFLEAGINQTLHRIMLDITITAHLLLPSGSSEAVITTPVCVTEAIIVGQVPQTYLNVNP